MVDMLRRRHGKSAAPPVPLLPTRVDHETVLARAGDEVCPHILLGLEERRLQPIAVDFGHHPHLLVLGDNECGKTAALRLVCREIIRTKTAEQAQLLIVDYRRALLGVVESEHLGGYAMSPPAWPHCCRTCSICCTGGCPRRMPARRSCEPGRGVWARHLPRGRRL